MHAYLGRRSMSLIDLWRMWVWVFCSEMGGVGPFVRHQAQCSDLAEILGMIEIESILGLKLHLGPCQLLSTLTNKMENPLS